MITVLQLPAVWIIRESNTNRKKICVDVIFFHPEICDMQAGYANLFTECCTYIVEGICFHLITVRPHPQVYKSIFKMWVFILVWASCPHANRILGHKNWDFFWFQPKYRFTKTCDVTAQFAHAHCTYKHDTLRKKICKCMMWPKINTPCSYSLIFCIHCLRCQTSISLNVFSAQMVFTTQENRNSQWTDMDESRCD